MDCGPSRPGLRAGPFELGGRSDIYDLVQQAGSGLMSPAAEELRFLATAVSAVCGRPGFVPDAGIWERAEGGYQVLDAEAVQVCVDRVRELRAQDAWLAGLQDFARSEPAVQLREARLITVPTRRSVRRSARIVIDSWRARATDDVTTESAVSRSNVRSV